MNDTEHDDGGESASSQASFMTFDDYFRLVLQAMKQHATYSTTRNAWVLSRVRAQIILLDHLDALKSPHLSAPVLLNDGVHRKLWDLGMDKEHRTAILILKS